ncbi:MAG: serine/threonine protein phosphatase [Proteobacteria bacterium]|nr:MAG: serine/threonine protein phosphatase [Pseudomonadota bacterium]
MKNPLHKILLPIKETQLIRGIQLPGGLEFRQLVVTGPPGAGKTSYINQIRGWPNEGYLDLSRKGWWRDKSLIYRPREVHLGIPYYGFDEALTVFDQEWLECPEKSRHIDYTRIRIPPHSQAFFHTNWRDKYVFEFLLPDPEKTYHQRLNRQRTGYFPTDAHLDLDLVISQTQTYREIALYLHRAGLNVYIRKDINKAPMLISEKGAVALPPWAVSDPTIDKSITRRSLWERLVFKQATIPWFTPADTVEQLSHPVRISHDGKEFELILGKRHLRISPELLLGTGRKKLQIQKNWLIKEPASEARKKMKGFARIKRGETILVGRANEEYHHLFNFDKSVGKRHLAITNIKGDLVLRPLNPDRAVRVVRLEKKDNRNDLIADRISAMLWIRSLFGTTVGLLPGDEALTRLLDVNEIMANEPYRPLDQDGVPGGLIELPDQPTPVIVGDLHGQVNNLLKILTENFLLEALKTNRAILCILGDAVHSEIAREMENMEGSILMMDLIFSLKRQFPANVFYIRGNHDDFRPGLAKNGIPQGLLMKRALMEKRGNAYVEAMSTFYDRLPFMILSDSFISCHAGPPRCGTTKEQIINLRHYPNIAKEITRNRPNRGHYMSGYGKAEIKSLRKELNKPKATPVIVGHTPLDPFGSVWQNVASIKNHHIVCSSHQEGPAFYIRIRNKLIPFNYPPEPLVRLINKIKSPEDPHALSHP